MSFFTKIANFFGSKPNSNSSTPSKSSSNEFTNQFPADAPMPSTSGSGSMSKRQSGPPPNVPPPRPRPDTTYYDRPDRGVDPSKTTPLGPQGHSSTPPNTWSSAGQGERASRQSESRKSAFTVREEREVLKPRWTFHCQLAHGSPTGVISGFESVKDLYVKISDVYDMDPNLILFCTLNTHKIDMNALLGGQLTLNDLIFAHIKGQKKEIEIVKEEPSLGLTITDNGAGYAFIRAIRSGSQMSHVSGVEVGDHIEKINGENFVGKRHLDVANALKNIPVGQTFLLRLISPEKSAFSMVNKPSGSRRGGGGGAGGPPSLSSGTKTVRLRAHGPATEEEMPTDIEESSIDAINKNIEQLLGISDRELAQSVFEMGRNSKNPLEFTNAVHTNLAEFEFSDEFILDCWGAMQDSRKGASGQSKASAQNGPPLATRATLHQIAE